MSFDSLESSLAGSKPVELYTFVLGSTSYHFTSSEDAIVVGTTTWTPEAIGRTDHAQSIDDRLRTMSITVPTTNAFAALYRNIVPGTRAVVTILRLQRDDGATPATILQYKGLVRSVNFAGDGRTAVIACKTVEATVSRQCPRFVYSHLCNYVLYDADCGVNPDLFKVTGVVTVVSGASITVPGMSINPDGWFKGGYVRPQGLDDRRMVLNHVGDVLTLLLPFSRDVLGFTVDAFAGCNHIISDDCRLKFNNVIENGGFAFVPTTNPFRTGIQSGEVPV